MNKILYNYSKKILNQEILDKRYILQYNDDNFINNIINLDDKDTKNIFQKELYNIIDNLDITLEYKQELKNLKYDIIIRNKTKNDKYYFNWHFDDKKLIIHNKNNKDKLHNLEFIYEDDKNIYGLYNNKNEKLLYTLIFYINSYNIDFNGGEFCFIDKIIKPVKGMILLFHSNELHKVNLLCNGKRKAIVVKFYNII